jgi:hypothetical protein
LNYAVLIPSSSHPNFATARKKTAMEHSPFMGFGCILYDTCGKGKQDFGDWGTI